MHPKFASFFIHPSKFLTNYFGTRIICKYTFIPISLEADLKKFLYSIFRNDKFMLNEMFKQNASNFTKFLEYENLGRIFLKNKHLTKNEEKSSKVSFCVIKCTIFFRSDF